MSAGEDDAPTDNRGLGWLGGGVLVLSLGLGAVALGYELLKPHLAEVPVPGLDQTVERGVTLPQVRRVGFGLRLGSFRYRGMRSIYLRYDLLRGTRVLASHRCEVFDFEGDLGGGTAVSAYSSACEVPVPDGGFDRVRLTLTRNGGGTLEVSEPVVLLYDP